MDVTIGALKRLTTLLAGQDIDAVDINGGAIDNTTIGASTRSTGAFTTLAANGAVTFTDTLAVTKGITGSSKITAAQFILNTAITTATTASAMSAFGMTKAGATAAKSYALPRPSTIGAFKYIRCTNATTSRKITISATASSAKFNSTATKVIFSNKNDAVSLIAETSTVWGVYGVHSTNGDAEVLIS